MPDTSTEKKTEKNYKSPRRKLVTFFRKSRDQWKHKCLEAKYQIKLLRNQTKRLKEKRASLTSEVKALEKELKRSKDKEEQLEQEIERLKKNG
jgi:septal ring factor EnvC (AmiA/AmiB activator)